MGPSTAVLERLVIDQDVFHHSWYDQTIDPEKYALERFVWRQLGRRDIVDGPGGDEEDV
jgi:hypothetical protein